jgi:mediator of RNA polymerase II transcription subunit 13
MNIGNSSLDGRFKHDQMRALSLTIYSQCRRFLVHQSGIRSLTGFGPAAATETFLKNKEVRSVLDEIMFIIIN